MKAKKILAVVLAVITVLCVIPFTAFAASPEITVIDGERVAFVSSFGRMSYSGKTYTAYRDFNEAFAALGKDGGKIIFTGTAKLGNFQDIEGRGDITIEGIGSKSQGNLLDFTGTEEAPVKEINLKGNILLDFLNIRLDEGAYIFTNGYTFKSVNEFDTYHTERYVADGPNIISYPNPPSIAPGEPNGAIGTIVLSSGTYSALVAGSVNGHTVNGDTFVSLDGGTVANVVSGNIGNGTMNGNAKLSIGLGEIDRLVAGSSGGTINGNVTTVINGGNIGEAIIGAEAGATINGSVVVALNGGNFAGTISAGTGTVTGKKIVITGADTVANIANGAADYIIKISGGLCEPQFDGASVNGFKFTDSYGVPAKTIKVNGADVSSENGIYQLEAGTSTVEITTNVTVALNSNANYVSGYEDGTFAPQKNMTRAEAITLLARLIIDENIIKGNITSNYTDVEDGAWYESYIGLFEKLGFLELIADRTGTKISPSQNITRGEFTQLIYEISNIDGGETSTKLISIPDVDHRNIFHSAIYSAVSMGVVTGYEDGTFRPDNTITRAEVVTMVNRLLGRTPTGNAGDHSFSDITGHWAYGQILAACNAEGVSWTPAPADGKKYNLTGSSAKDYAIALYDQSATLDASAIREGVDVIAEQMKKDILNTPNTADIYGDKMTGTIYYVSEKNGNDDNDGKTPETAVKTIAGLNKVVRFPRPGTSFLFERGGIYRGQLSVASNGLILGSYGEGDKPLIMQSRRNFADQSLWVETDWPNVWKCTESLTNVGVIGFDHDLFDYSEDSYNELYGDIMNANLFGVKGVQDLNKDLQFYSVLSNDQTTGGTVKENELYLYSDKGNPGSRFKSIEIGENKAIVSGKGDDVIIDNIAFKFTGGHGMGGAGGCKNRTVTNCIYSWLGGSILSLDFRGNGRPVNYGNAVEIYGSCNGYLVENNWMYQLYDTGVTHQFSDGTACTQEGVKYYGNLIELCHWGIEFYNAMGDGTTPASRKYTRDVHIAYNVVRDSGYGWGSITRYRQGGSYAYCGSSLSLNEDELTEYNIFDRSAGYVIYLPANSNEKDDKNIYIQNEGNTLGMLKGNYFKCDFDAAYNIRKYLGDENAVVIVIE